MKIITDGYPEDDEIFLAEAKITYWQNPDCTEDREEEPQEIILSTRDNGVSKFINIKTDNWSIDSSLDTLLDDFKTRIGWIEEKQT